MSNLQGYTFFCSLLSIISRESDKKASLDKHKKEGNAFGNGEKDELTHDWAVFAQKVVRNNISYAKELVDQYSKYASRCDKYGQYIDDYKDIVALDNTRPTKQLMNAFNSIFVKQKGAQPYFFFGLAATIAMGAEKRYQDDNFFIGVEESKEILFKAMEVFNFINVECIPESYFDDRNFTILLLAALYNAFLVVFPYHEGHRDKNYEDGLDVLNSILDSDLDSELFDAVRRASESKDIINELWRTQDSMCLTIPSSSALGMNFEQFYMVPEMVSEYSTKLLNKESNRGIRSYVEGKAGSGKSSLAKAIVLACSGSSIDREICSQIREALGIDNQKYEAILLDYSEMEYDELKEYGLFGNALDQMYRRAVQQIERNQNVIKHYSECKDFVQRYVERKAAQGALILLIDDFSFVDNALSSIFLKQLNDLIVLFSNLNVVLFSNKLKPSERRKFSKYSFFQLTGTFSASQAFEKLTLLEDDCNTDAIINDRIVSAFIDTPGNMLKYLEQGREKGVFRLVSECIDEEIDRKCDNEVLPEFCKSLLDHLVIEALNRRIATNDPIVLLGNSMSADFLKHNNLSRDEGLAIWEVIQKRHILIERSTRVNSFEFCNPLYFDSLIADQLVEMLESMNEYKCAGFTLSVLSKLSCAEFIRILVNIFYRITAADSYYMKRSIREENLDMFVKAIAGVMITYDRVNELEECLWAANRILEDISDGAQFWRRGDYEYRRIIFRRLVLFKELLGHRLEQKRESHSK